MKISKKTIGLLASTLIVATAGFIYYQSTQDNGEVKGWMDSSWTYRKSITVANAGGTPLTNEEVLIEMDTASLVTASKLQSDCDDLRFVDSDGSTSIDYWVEGGCNTSTTQIWVEIPNLPGAGTTIYVYYANPSAANAEQSWTGNFLALNTDASCPTGWSRNTSFDDKFGKGASSLGTTGGSSAAHGHNNISATFSGCSTKDIDGEEMWNWASPSHSHTASIPVNNSTATTLPPYMDIPYCGSSKLSLTTENVSIFTSLPSSGWTRFSALDSKFPRSSSAYGTTGGADNHTHTSTSTNTSTAGTFNNVNSPGSAVSVVVSSHYHNVPSHTSTTGSNLPPYIDVIFGYVDSNGTKAPSDIINPVTALPPLGWDRYSAFDDKYLRGASSYGATSGSLTHTHQFTFTTGSSTGSGTVDDVPNDTSICQVHTHTAGPYTTNSVTMEPPYYTLIYAQKRDSETVTVNEEQANSIPPDAPSSLLCEGDVDPTEVIDPTPEFSAVYTDDDVSDTAQYYQIQVNTASNFTGTTMWDSTQTAFGTPVTNGARSPDISYAGTNLDTNTTYYWRIRFWDGTYSGDWSSTANFTTTNEKFWVSGDFPYRTSITVSNSQGSTLTNEEVLVVFDTSTLISEGKLQNDCDDIRVTDSDGGAPLDYWIEGGCNSSTTQIWVEIPSLPSAGTTIYIYYGNATASSGEESWSGSFVMNSTASCTSGWTSSSDHVTNSFALGSDTYGTTFNGQHNHSTMSCTTGGASGSTSNVCTWSEGTKGLYIQSHTHTSATVMTNNATIEPPYINYYVCTKSKFEIYSNLVAFFDATGDVPTSWTRESSADGLFIKNTTSYGGTGGSLTHSHNTTGGYTTGSAAGFADGIPDNYFRPATHDHDTVNGSTSTSNNNIPYLELLLYKADDGSIEQKEYIVMAKTAVPPMGWNRYSSMDGKFVKGASTPGGSYAGANHNHTSTITTDTPNQNDGNNASGCTTGVQTPSHTHSCTATSSNVQAMPASITTLFIQRKTSEATSTGTEETANTSPDQPTSPLCEGETNPTGVIDSTPEFSAIFSDDDTSDTGNYYQIEVNTASDFTGTSMWDSTKTAFGTPVTNGQRCPDIAYAGSSFDPGTTYYWRIKFWDNQTIQSESSWSETQNFTMGYTPNAPTNILIQGEDEPTKVTDTTPDISAIFTDTDESDTANYYEIEINTQSDFAGTSMWDTGKTSTSVTNHGRSSNYTYAGTALSTDGSTYYLRMRWWDGGDFVSDWSETQTFIMQGPPNTPTELRKDSSTPTAPTFSAVYTDPNGDSASAYEVEVNDASNFLGNILLDTGKTSATITNGERSSEIGGCTLTNSGDTLYWRIRFWDSDDTVSDWSTTMFFTDSPSSLHFEGLGLEGIGID